MIEIGTGIDIAKGSLEIAGRFKSLQTLAKRTLNHITKGELVMPVLGVGGVGKTTFSKLMQGINPLEFGDDYDESIRNESMKIKTEQPVALMIAAGQGRRVNTYTDIFKAIDSSRRFGLINVVSYGYHNLQTHSYKKHLAYQETMSEAAFLELYLEGSRLREIASVGRLAKEIKTFKKNSFVLTIIAKQDLWYNERDKVIDHYQTGEYASAIKPIEDLGLKHYIIPSAFNVANFKTVAGEILAKTAEGYDFSTYLRYSEKLQNDLAKLCEGQ